MESSYHHHDISDEVWALLEPHLSGQRGQWGEIAQDNRRFINAVFWGAANRIPLAWFTPRLREMGNCSSKIYPVAQKRHLGKTAGNPDRWSGLWMAYDWCKSYQSTSSHGWGKGWKSGHVQDKRGLNTKIYLAVDAHGMPVRILITEGAREDCKEAVHLIEGISAEVLLADRDYGTNDILAYAISAGMEAVIPPKRTVRNNANTTNTSTDCVIW